MKRYSDFNSVEELYEYYNISPKNMITEKKEVDIPGEKGNKDEDKPTKVVKKEKLEVVYSDLKATPQISSSTS